MSLARCSSVNGANGEFMSAFLPDFTVAYDSQLVHRAVHHDLAAKDADRSGSVPGCATIVWAGIVNAAARGCQIRHGHDEWTRRLRVARNHQLAPDDIGGDRDPPGLSTRITMARIDSSSRICRICSTIVSEPTMAPLTGSYALLPDAITPSIEDRNASRRTDAYGLRCDALIQRSVDGAILAFRSLQDSNSIVELIKVGEVVDEARAVSGFGCKRPFVQQRAHLLHALASPSATPCTS